MISPLVIVDTSAGVIRDVVGKLVYPQSETLGVFGKHLHFRDGDANRQLREKLARAEERIAMLELENKELKGRKS